MPRITSKTVLIVTALCLTLGYLIYAHVLCRLEEFCVVRSIDAGQDRTVMIGNDSFSDFGNPFYYQVAVGDQVVVPTTLIWGCCHDDRSPRFRILYSKDRNLIGIVWEKRPEILLMQHDFTTGENWPRGEDGEGLEKDMERGVRLRDRLTVDNPELVLKLK